MTPKYGEPAAVTPLAPAPLSPVAVEIQTAPRDEYSILHRRGAWRDALRRRLLALADVLSVALTVSVVAALGFLPFWSLALVPLWGVLAKLYGLYDNDHRALRHLTADELPTIAAWITTSTAMQVLLVSTIDSKLDVGAAGLRLWIATILTAPVFRAAARTIWRAIVPPETSLLIGSGPLEVATRRKLELFGDIHVNCGGTLTDAGGVSIERLQTRLDSLAEEGTPVDRVIVASAHVDELLIASLVETCRRHRMKLSVVPPARAMFGTAVQLRHIAELPMIEYSTWDAGRSTILIKRIIDVLVSSVALLVVAPLLLLIAILVKIDSRGPGLFVQKRAGQHGEPFRMYKFRTMTADAEHRLRDVVDLEQLADPMFKLRSDPRVTRLGRFLRRMSFDELPQLVNVWRGEMSLVGPRPEELALVQRYRPEHRFRLAVKPGITGPMQVYGRGELEFEERLAVEREYVENLSLRRDLRIIVLTATAVFRGGGAF